MSVRVFFDTITQPNMQKALEEPNDERHAVNAVLTLDATAGILFVTMQAQSDPAVLGLTDDDRYRDQLAAQSDAFRLLRDLAASYKHGQLTRPKAAQPRLVHRPNQVTESQNTLGTFQVGDRLGGNILTIQLSSGGFKRASSVIAESYSFLKVIVDRVAPP